MSTSVFKGILGTGTTTAKFCSDFSNVDTDLLTMSYAETGGKNAQVDKGISAPGGFANVQLKTKADGLLEVFVVTGHPNESGRLTVSLDGQQIHDEAIMGPVRWVYSVSAS
jgi:hypothetical protein